MMPQQALAQSQKAARSSLLLQLQTSFQPPILIPTTKIDSSVLLTKITGTYDGARLEFVSAMAQDIQLRDLLKQTPEQVLLTCKRGAMLWAKDGVFASFIDLSRWMTSDTDPQGTELQRPEVYIDIGIVSFTQYYHHRVSAGSSGERIYISDIRPKFKLTNTEFRIRTRDIDLEYPFGTSNPTDLRVIRPGVGYFDASSSWTGEDRDHVTSDEFCFYEALEFLFEGQLAADTQKPTLFKIQVPGAASYFYDRKGAISHQIRAVFAALVQASLQREDGQPAKVIVVAQTTEKIAAGLRHAQGKVARLQAELLSAQSPTANNNAPDDQQQPGDQQPDNQQSSGDQCEDQLLDKQQRGGDQPNDQPPDQQGPKAQNRQQIVHCMVCLRPIASGPVGMNLHYKQHQRMHKENEHLSAQNEDLRSLELLASRDRDRAEAEEVEAQTELLKESSGLREKRSHLEGARKLLDQVRRERDHLQRRLDAYRSQKTQARNAAVQGLPTLLGQLADAQAQTEQANQELERTRTQLQDTEARFKDVQDQSERRRQQRHTYREERTTYREEIDTADPNRMREVLRAGLFHTEIFRERATTARLTRELADMTDDRNRARIALSQRPSGGNATARPAGAQGKQTDNQNQPVAGGDPRPNANTQTAPAAGRDGPSTAQLDGREPTNGTAGPDRLPYCDGCLVSLNKLSPQVWTHHPS